VKSRAPYTECRIYVDGCPELDVGHFISTTRSAYRVQSMRQDRKRPQRRHLVCLRWPIAEIPAGSTVFEFKWYPRRKKRATTLAQMAERAEA
jgi:hypothetical protein